MKRDATNADRRRGFSFAMARTWKTVEYKVEDKAIQDLVRHLPKTDHKLTWVQGLPGLEAEESFGFTANACGFVMSVTSPWF